MRNFDEFTKEAGVSNAIAEKLEGLSPKNYARAQAAGDWLAGAATGRDIREPIKARIKSEQSVRRLAKNDMIDQARLKKAKKAIMRKRNKDIIKGVPKGSAKGALFYAPTPIGIPTAVSAPLIAVSKLPAKQAELYYSEMVKLAYDEILAGCFEK